MTFLSAQALSKALTDLRADMVSQAQVLANDASQEKNIQKIINEHTKQISVSCRCLL